MLPAEMSALFANSLQGLSSIFDQQHFYLLDNLDLDLRPPMVFLGVRCLPRSSGLLERVESTSEQLLRQSVLLNKDSFKLLVDLWRPLGLQEQELHDRSNVLLREWFFHVGQVKL